MQTPQKSLIIQSSCCVCLSGSSHWSRRAQRGSCVLPGKRWGWSRAAVAAAAAGAWCDGGDTRSNSSIWRWSPKPTKTLQWVKDQHSHVMVPVELWQNGEKKVLMWLFASYRKIRMFYCTSLQGILHKMPAANTNTGDHILPTSGSDKVKHSHACILFACMCCIMNFMAQYQFNRHWQVQSCSYLLEKSTTDL